MEEREPRAPKLGVAEARAASMLLSALDVALQRHVLRLSSPFGLEESELNLWRENLFQLAGALEKCVVAADGCLEEPDSLVGDLRDLDAVLRVPCEVVAARGVGNEELEREYRELMAWLVGYLSYGSQAIRFWMVSEPERFGRKVEGGGLEQAVGE